MEDPLLGEAQIELLMAVKHNKGSSCVHIQYDKQVLY